jgi:hypothetical protein
MQRCLSPAQSDVARDTACVVAVIQKAAANRLAEHLDQA